MAQRWTSTSTFFEHEGALGWGFLCSACVVGIRVAVEYEPAVDTWDIAPAEEAPMPKRRAPSPSHDGWQPLSDQPVPGEHPFTAWLRARVLPIAPDVTIWYRPAGTAEDPGEAEENAKEEHNGC